MLLLKGSGLVYSLFIGKKERKKQACSTVPVLSVMTRTFDLSAVNDVTHLDWNPVPPGNLMAN